MLWWWDKSDWMIGRLLSKKNDNNGRLKIETTGKHRNIKTNWFLWICQIFVETTLHCYVRCCLPLINLFKQVFLRFKHTNDKQLSIVK